MRSRKSLVAGSPLMFLLVVSSAAGCLPTCGTFRTGPNFSMSSGDLKDDDVEEPIPAIGQRFAPLLTRSNEFVVMLQEKRTKDFYEQALDETLKQKVTQADFEKLYAEILDKAGPVQSYKAQQWKFHEQIGGVASSKIVHHRGASVYYTFTFANTTATRLIGVHFRQRAVAAADAAAQ